MWWNKSALTRNWSYEARQSWASNLWNHGLDRWAFAFCSTTLRCPAVAIQNGLIVTKNASNATLLSGDLSLICQVYANRCSLSLPIVCLCIWAANWVFFLFVESHERATSDLGMAYNRARVLPHSDEQLGNSVASKVYPCLSLLSPWGFVYSPAN